MNEKVLVYKIPEIPDPLYPEYQMAARGDVLSAAGDDCKHLLWTIANLPPGAVSMTVRFVFNPNPTNEDKQSRMGTYVMAKYEEKGLGDTLRIQFERGPLTTFYKLKSIGPLEVPWIEPQAACEILRREDAVDPLHPFEFNDRIPAYYYTIAPFKANSSNDYVNLDRVLGGIGEQVIIDVCVEPADVSAELSEHTRYLSRLQTINRKWDQDQDDGPGYQDYLEHGSGYRPVGGQGLKPLRYMDPQADEILHSQQRFHETLRQSHLLFHIIVLAQTPAVARLIGSLVADSAFEEGSYRLLTWNKGEKSFDMGLRSLKELHVSALPVHESLFQGKDPSLYSGLARLSHVATVDELAGVFRLPVASVSSPHCIRKNTDPPHEKDQDIVSVGNDQENPGILRGPTFSSLVKHMFVTGTPGFGKTSMILEICVSLHQHGIPFLVVESVKTEYRRVKTLRNHADKNVRDLAERLEVYTPGNENVSPFRFNPLKVQNGISVNEHIDGNVMSCFLAAMPLPGPLLPILGEALERVYEDYSENGNPPLMVDLIGAAERVLAEKRYSTDTNSDIRGALDARLGVLTRRSIGEVFQCRHSIPSIDHLMNVSAVLELDRLPIDQKCLLTLFILTGIRSTLRTVPKSDKVPRYVVIIEEAHNVVGRTGEAKLSPDIADPKAFAAEYVCRMLAEVRALGVGIIIVDQLPSAIAPEVIKTTATKIAFHQMDKEDREVIGASMLLNHMEIEELARLIVGEAFFYTEGYHRPRRITTLTLFSNFDFSAVDRDEDILPHVRDDARFQQAAAERTASELSELRERMDRFDDKRLQMIQELASLMALHPRILARPRSEERERRLARLKEDAFQLKQRLSDAFRSFVRDSYRRYLTPETEGNVQDTLIQEVRSNLVGRFESIVKPDVKKCLDLIDAFIRRCQEADK